MTYAVVSYARQDEVVARALVKLLRRHEIDVFWDRSIQVGDDYKKVIARRIDDAACVVVLWSAASVASVWVEWEAERARKAKLLIETTLDGAEPPPPFLVKDQVADLSGWDGVGPSSSVAGLVQAITRRVAHSRSTDGSFSLAAPQSGQPVTDQHLALIHTCWRSRRHEAEFGTIMYRWDMCLFGSAEALDRVDRVTYILHPAYEDRARGSSALVVRNAEASRGTCFELRQLANGHSLVRAIVALRGQDEPLYLSRYVNVFDSPNKIEEYRV